VLSHANVLASMAGLVDASDFTNKDVYLAYLPLAHIMARLLYRTGSRHSRRFKSQSSVELLWSCQRQ